MIKVRKDFLLAMFILFVIPIAGYFVLKRAEDDRMKISAGLQPKDSIALDLEINFLNAEGVARTGLLVDMPYIIKVIATRDSMLDMDQLGHILYVINDRTDLAFLIYEDPIRHTVKNRIPGYNYVRRTSDLSRYGDILLVDAFNRILQVYEQSDPELYKKLLEDISYALPMVDYRIEKLNEDETSE